MPEAERSAFVERALQSADGAKQKLLSLGGRIAETVKDRLVRDFVLEVLSGS